MNILIIGHPYKNLVAAIKKSKFAEKIYVFNSDEDSEFPTIQANSFQELLKNASLLKIDISINTDKTLINEGICEAFKNSKINLISVNKKWLNLETRKIAAKQLLIHYNINTPKLIKVPVNFPVMLKAEKTEFSKSVYSIKEIVFELERHDGEGIYVEEFFEGQKFDLFALRDGKSMYYINLPANVTEVQLDRLELLKTKLNFMFSDEKADFTGFLAINLVWSKNDWYVIGFNMNISEASPFKDLKYDLLSLLNSAIYQNLNELN